MPNVLTDLDQGKNPCFSFGARWEALAGAKGQLISKCLFEVIIWTKIPMKNLTISAVKEPGQKLSNFLLVFW